MATLYFYVCFLEERAGVVASRKQLRPNESIEGRMAIHNHLDLFGLDGDLEVKFCRTLENAKEVARHAWGDKPPFVIADIIGGGSLEPLEEDSRFEQSKRTRPAGYSRNAEEERRARNALEGREDLRNAIAYAQLFGEE